MDNAASNIKIENFRDIWDREYIELDYNGIKGEFYPNELGLVEIRDLLFRESEVLEEILLDGDFALIDNFDDDFYGFAYLRWDSFAWVLIHFSYDPRT